MNNDNKKFFKTEKEWLTFKDTLTVSASTIGAVSGENDYQSGFEAWERKTGRVPSLEPTLQMLIGIHGEEMVLKVFKHLYPQIEYLRDRSEISMYIHPIHKFIGISPDEEVYWNNERMLMEVKTTRAYSDVSEIPNYIKLQCQLQMECSGYKKCLLVWLNLMKTELDFTIIEFDQVQADFMLEKAIAFNDCVVNDYPPPLQVLSDYRDFSEGDIEASEDAVLAFLGICKINDLKKQVKQQEKLIKEELASYINEGTTLIKDGIKLVDFKGAGRRTVDVEKLKADGLYEEYSVFKESRRMTPKYNNIDKL